LLEDRLVPSQVTMNTDTLTISGDGDNNDHAFYGVPFTASVVDGVAQFRIAGDLNVPSGDRITVTGSRPAALFVGNDLTIGGGTTFDASANGSAPGPGGGWGGGTQGGPHAGGSGGAPGVGGSPGAGGAGGTFTGLGPQSGGGGSAGGAGN
jgi:hypothetical protein